MAETLVVRIGGIHDLDAAFSEATKTRKLVIGGKQHPSADRKPGPDVLLAASAESIPGGGSVYLIVGVLHGARVLRDEMRVEFDSLERFIIPLVVSDSTGAADRDLLGAVKYWSPSYIYWVPIGGAERCVAEARRLLTRLRKDAAPRPRRPVSKEDARRRYRVHPGHLKALPVAHRNNESTGYLGQIVFARSKSSLPRARIASSSQSRMSWK